MRRSLVALSRPRRVSRPRPPRRAGRFPTRPEKLTFPPLVVRAARARRTRVVLNNGIVVYIAEDRALPLVNIRSLVRGGSYLEPAGKEGLAALTGSQMRRGGPESLDRRAARREARLPRRAGRHRHRRHHRHGVSLNCLAENLDGRCRSSSTCCASRASRRTASPRRRSSAPGHEAAQRRHRRTSRAASGPPRSTATTTSRTASRPRPRWTSITRDDLVAFHRRSSTRRTWSRRCRATSTARRWSRKLERRSRAGRAEARRSPPGARRDRHRRARASTASRRT